MGVEMNVRVVTKKYTAGRFKAVQTQESFPEANNIGFLTLPKTSSIPKISENDFEVLLHRKF